MTNYKLYLNILAEFSTPMDLKTYCLHMVPRKQQELLKLEERYKRKHKKYSKTLNQLMWQNACSSSLSIASGISSVVMLTTFVGLLVSILLGAISLAGASISGVAMALINKYQRNS